MIRPIAFYHPFFVLLSHSAFHIVKSLVLKTLAAFFYQSTFATAIRKKRHSGSNVSKNSKTMKQLIKGVIKGATQVQQFEKKNGQTNVKCVLHIVGIDDSPHPEELAVTVCGALTLYAASVGSPVAVEYIVRVFSFEKGGKTMFGNDVYATSIQPWQP